MEPRIVPDAVTSISSALESFSNLMDERRMQELPSLFPEDDLAELRGLITLLHVAGQWGIIEWCQWTNDVCRVLRSCRSIDRSPVQEERLTVNETLMALDLLRVRIEFLFEYTGYSFFRTLVISIRQAQFVLEDLPTCVVSPRTTAN